MTVTLDTLNASPPEAFAAALAGVFEEAPSVAPWVAVRAAALRPFATVTALHDAMMAVVREAPAAERLAFLRGHPELASTAGAMAPLSKAEQDSLDLAGADGFGALNAAYAGRFGFPFILCIRRHTRRSVLDVFHRRSASDPAAEGEAALREVGFITRLRLAERVSGPGVPVVHGSLTTHVLDTAAGRPAAGIPVELREVDGPLLARGVTDAQGRTPPLLSGAPLRIGLYELAFDTTAHFAAAVHQPAFLGIIPIRFGICEPEADYHVPLLVSPGGYTTYRGS